MNYDSIHSKCKEYINRENCVFIDLSQYFYYTKIYINQFKIIKCIEYLMYFKKRKLKK